MKKVPFTILFMLLSCVGFASAALSDITGANYPFNVNYSDIGPLGNHITSTSNTNINTTHYKLGNGSATWSFNSAATMTIPTAVNLTYNWSFSAWMYKTQFGTSSDEDYIIGDWAGANFNILLTAYTKNGSIRICNGNGAAADCKETNLTLGNNAWTHFAMSRNGTNVKMWINGSSAMNWDSAYQGAQTANTRRLGAATTPTSADSFNGTMDDVTFFNRSINQNDVDTLFNSGSGFAYPFTSGSTVYTITISAQNILNGTNIAGFCANVTNGSSSASACNSTGSTLVFNNTQVFNTINITVFNVTNHYNGTSLNYPFTTTDTKSVTVPQSIINVSARMLHTNATVTTFNASVSSVQNQTTTGSVLVYANNGSNTVTITSYGNYSTTYTVIVASPVSITQANVTGVYDSRITVGAKHLSSAVASFNATMTNTSYVVRSMETTTAGIVFNATQGVTYSFLINASGYTIAEASQTASASTHTVNASVYLQNSFFFNFRNESDDSTLIRNVTVILVSDDYNANYSTQNGSLEVTLLVPGEYQITYYYDQNVPREYFTTLTPQSFQNITLYTIDEDISTFYLPKALDKNGYPCAGNIITSKRYYVYSNTSGEYKTVEMAKTDSNGQAVLRVVPNIINYKLSFSGSCGSFESAPQKFTATTNSFIVTDQSTGLSSYVGMESVTRSCSFNNNTNTFVFSWTDTSNIVREACLQITKKSRLGVINASYYSACSSSSSGSLIHTVTDTNGTAYTGSCVIETNTEFSTFSDIVAHSFDSAYQSFGKAGLFVTLLVLLVVIFLAAGRSELMVIGGVGSIAVMGLMGFISFSWSYVVGIIIIAVMIAYKSRT